MTLMDDVGELELADPIRTYESITSVLQQGVASGKHAWHLMTLANINLQGAPDARTVVMRGFDPQQRQIRFHTDWRSPKVREFQADPRVTLVLYDPVNRWQLRIPARTTVHHLDEVAHQAWHRSMSSSRICYALPDPPSSPIGDSDWPDVPGIPDPHDLAVYGNFCAVTCHFEAMEILVLRAAGHRRARIEWQGSEVKLVRLAP